MSRSNERRFITRVAQRYHLEGQRQAEIARELRISQATVSRLLKRAQDEGIVRISISAPEGMHPETERALRERYGLEEAIVVETSGTNIEEVMARIGEGAAYFLEATLQNGEIIGVSSWSQTILKMLDNIHPMKSGRAKAVVQMLGGVGNPSVQKHATQLTTRLAQLTGAEPIILNAPGVAASREAKIVLLGDPYARSVMDRYDEVSLAIVGIGAMEPSQMLADSGNIFSAEELRELTDRGAVAEIGLRFMDAGGGVVRTPLDDRVIGMSLEQLQRVPRVIAMAGGDHKTEAIRAVLLSGILNVLVTDPFTAERLLSEESVQRSDEQKAI